MKHPLRLIGISILFGAVSHRPVGGAGDPPTTKDPRTTKRLISLSLVFGAIVLGTPAGAEDEVLSALVRDALSASLVRDSSRVASVRSVLAEDEFEDPDSWSGLLDDLAALEIVSSSDTRGEKAKRLRKRAKDLNDPVARERLTTLADRVEEYRLGELIKRRRWNRVSRVLNRTTKTASEVATGQPRALAVAGVDTVYSLTGKSAPTTEDRKIAYLAGLSETHESVSAKDLAKAQAIASKLEKKTSRRLINGWKSSVEIALDDGDTTRAERLSRLAAQVWPEEEWFRETLSEIEASDPSPPTNVETASVALDEDERARIELLSRELVRPSDRVETYSDTPARSLISAAKQERRGKTLDYLLFGETAFESHRAARTLAAQGSQAPASLGLLQGFETAVRGASLFFKNELGAREAIESYAFAERQTPGALVEKDYLRWADLCAEVEDYSKALDVLETSGVEDPRRQKRYRSKWAGAIVKRCKDLPPGKDRYGALRFVVDELGDTKSARKAEDLLAETPSVDRPLVRIEASDLRDRETLAVTSGLLFDRAWWDGDKANGEVEKDHFYWDPEGLVWYRVEKNSPWRKVAQPPEALPRLSAFFATLEDIGVARALTEKRRGKPFLPVEIEGGIGSETYLIPKIVERDLSSDDDWLFE